MNLLPDGHRDGATYDPALDRRRLNRQAQLVFDVMSDGRWYTLADIAAETGQPEPSVSARIRDFRKARFGGHTVHRVRVAETGLWRYRLQRNRDWLRQWLLS